MSGNGKISKRCPCPAGTACRKDHGSWSIRFAVRDPRTGERQQRRESGFRTRDDARRRLAELTAGVAAPRQRQTFADYAASWLESRARKVRRNTLSGYETAIGHANDKFGATAIGDVTRRDVERLAHQLADAGRSQRTVSLTLFVIRSIFAAALDDGLINRNPAARGEAIGRAAKEREALTAAELGKVRSAAAADPWHALWLLSLAGLRRSEVLGLKWSDIDLSSGVLRVERGVTAGAGSRRNTMATPTKTRNGQRTLPLPADMVAALRALRDSQAAKFGFEQVRTGWLAIGGRAVPLRPELYSDEWARLCQAALGRRVVLHAARHTSVTAMLNAGVPLRIVSAWHGHDPVVAARVYDHPDREALSAAGVALSAAMTT